MFQTTNQLGFNHVYHNYVRVYPISEASLDKRSPPNSIARPQNRLTYEVGHGPGICTCKGNLLIILILSIKAKFLRTHYLSICLIIF